MGKYATRETEVDDLLRHGVFVDLYKVVRQGVRDRDAELLAQGGRAAVPARRRTGDVVSAAGSMVEYQRWIDRGRVAALGGVADPRGIRDYNQVDCDSTWGLRSWLLDRQRESGIGYAAADPERSEGAMPRMTRSRRPSSSPTASSPAPTPANRSAPRRPPRPAPRLARRVPPPRGEADVVADVRSPQRVGRGPLRRRRLPCRPGPHRHRAASNQALLGPGVRVRPDQDTKLHVGSRFWVAGTRTLVRDHRHGRGRRPGRGQGRPGSRCPTGSASSTTSSWAPRRSRRPSPATPRRGSSGIVASQAVDDLLRRRPPRIAGHAGGPLICPGDDLVVRTVDLAAASTAAPSASRGLPAPARPPPPPPSSSSCSVAANASASPPTATR